MHSFLFFRIDHLGLSKIIGRFNQVDGSLDFDPDNPTQLKLNGAIATNSIDLNNKDLEDTLQQADWLDAQRYTQIVFNSESVESRGDNRLAINGTLAIRGVKQAVTLDTTFNGGADNLITRKYTIGFSATTSILRSDFGLDAFSAFAGDLIEIELHGEFQRQ